MAVKVTSLIWFFSFFIATTSNANNLNNNVQKSGELIEKIILLTDSDDVMSFYKTGVMLDMPQIMDFNAIKVENNNNGSLIYRYKNNDENHPLDEIRHLMYIEDNGFDVKKVKRLVQFKFKPQSCLKIEDYKYMFGNKVERYLRFFGVSMLEKSGLAYEAYRIRTEKYPIAINPFDYCMLEVQTEYEVE